MIHINLLPVRQAKQAQYGRQQIAFGAVVLLLLCAVLGYFYMQKMDELTQVENEAKTLQDAVTQLTKDNEVIAQLNVQRESLQNLSRVLEELEANRAGPVQVLDELKTMLNVPPNDLERVVQEKRGWSSAWDARNVWLTSFSESKGSVQMTGFAQSNDDIAEFNSRLSSSVYFKKVRLNFTSLQETRDRVGPGRKVYQFSISATVDYGIVSEKEQG